MAPSHVCNVIICACQKGCGFNCLCRKSGLECTLACVNCCGSTCTNCPTVPAGIVEPNVTITEEEEDENNTEYEEVVQDMEDLRNAEDGKETSDDDF